MLTIAGNGMGDYTFKNLPLDVEEFDRVICDINFSESGESILKLKYRDAKEYILENYSIENILYVVTGSPLFFSAGALIAKSIPRDMVKIIDNRSSIDYLLSKLIIPKNQVSVLSLHGRSRIDLKNFLTDRYIFILCDRYSIDKIREATKYLDNSAFSVIVGYKLGYSDEVIEEIDIREEIDLDLNQPYVLLVEKKFNSSPLSRDSEFKTERGMITKEYKRNLSLQAARPRAKSETLGIIGRPGEVERLVAHWRAFKEDYKGVKTNSYLEKILKGLVDFLKGEGTFQGGPLYCCLVSFTQRLY